MIAFLSDPYVLFGLACALCGFVGWVGKVFAWPALVEWVQRFIKANMGDVVKELVRVARDESDARIDALRHEFSERLTNDERRYDDALNDMRDEVRK